MKGYSGELLSLGWLEVLQNINLFDCGICFDRRYVAHELLLILLSWERGGGLNVSTTAVHRHQPSAFRKANPSYVPPRKKKRNILYLIPLG